MCLQRKSLSNHIAIDPVILYYTYHHLIVILTEHAAIVTNVHLTLDNQMLLHVDVEGGLGGELATTELTANDGSMYGALNTNNNYSM